MQGFIDIHCHCLPDLDDGPEDMEQAIALCRALVEDGIETVVATPHMFNSFSDATDIQIVLHVVDQLRVRLQTEGVTLNLLPGAEVTLNDQIFDLLKRGQLPTLNQGQFLLLEIPSSLYMDITTILEKLNDHGIRCILAHPERWGYLKKNWAVLDRWTKLGVGFQISASSLLTGAGWFGRMKSPAWQFVEKGYATVIASDAHDIQDRRPRMRQAYRILAKRIGTARALQLCIHNPQCLIRKDRLSEHRNSVNGESLG
ncbi:MAG: hypothetical protein JXA82_14295 [Sedimentisphaerales bacterium]|nr:hypothetical protein [Sedimentisphaerales bacterium]